MKKIVLLLFIISMSNLFAQDVTTVEAKSDEISDNLDLEAVASVFGESESLEDFEKRLNDPDTQISNLDMNEDGEVDYLRVLETSKDDTHLITIQAVIGKDQFQDVATIDVEKDSKGETQVQVVGDVYMYGPNYIVEPVYVHPPVFFVFFWGPRYSPWYSPYYYGYYPPYYRPWRPYPPHRYRTNVNVHVNVNNTYNHTTVRKSKTSVTLQNKSRRNDYAKKNPDRSFAKRNKGVSNRSQLSKTPKASNSKAVKPAANASTGKKVQKDWTPPSKVDRNKTKASTRNTKAPNSRVNNTNNRVPNNTKTSVPKTRTPKPTAHQRPATRTRRR